MSVSLRRDVVILACAVSAGIHGALAPGHFREGAGGAVGSVAATVLLAALAVALTRRREVDLLYAATAVVFGGLISSYAVAATIGLPVLHPEPEPVDGLALVTKGIEAVGAVAAATLFSRRAAAVLHPRTKGI